MIEGTEAEALRLLKGFMRIADPLVRQKIIEMVEAAANEKTAQRSSK